VGRSESRRGASQRPPGASCRWDGDRHSAANVHVVSTTLCVVVEVIRQTRFVRIPLFRRFTIKAAILARGC
jgi:hypothetical protein